MATPKLVDVDAYIAAAPKESRAKLRQLRRVIKAAAPKAVEGISYGMPYYAHQGRLVYFAGYKNHVGLYAAVPQNDAYAKERKRYMAAKSTLQLPIDEPLPVALITKLVKARVKENDSKVAR